MNPSKPVAFKTPKKLIEVALPLDAINEAAAREKSIRHGHPSTLHLWWARRPLAAARAVIFAQLVNDPGFQRGEGFCYGRNKKEAEAERKRLFDIIKRLVKWENTNNEEVLEEARAEIARSWREVCELNKDHPQAAELFNPDQMPGLHDPFAGGGSIPLEAQRLGLSAFASDLNPVAVLINKAMIEIPPRFGGRAPVNPQGRAKASLETWAGARGLAEDVRYYGSWMRERALERIGHLYPRVKITEAMAEARADLKELVGKELTVIAWLWARTVRTPNPAFLNAEVPLVSTFVLGSKEGKEAYVWPVVDDKARSYRFEVKVGKPPKGAEDGTAAGKRAAFRCLMSQTPISYDYIRDEGRMGRIGARLMAIVAEGERGRVYLSPTAEMEEIARQAKPGWKPETALPANPRDFKTPNYGMKTYGDLFTPRQLVALTTFCDLVGEAREQVVLDALAAGMGEDGKGLEQGGMGARAYGEAVACYLGLVSDRLADRNSSLCGWDLAQAARGREATVRNVFARQAIAMAWDFAEVNTISDGAGGIESALNAVVRVVERLEPPDLKTPELSKVVQQADAQNQSISQNKFISTDPPYYDNIGYADLSDFFYVWLRRSLKNTFPSLFATMAVPKAEELVATPYRHGTKEKAEDFFLSGMTEAMRRLAQQAHPSAPITIYYAFKQSETKDASGTSSTGWETFLEAVLKSGLSVSGTWPMRTELSNRMVGKDTNALASSIVLVCRKRAPDATTISRRDFMRELNATLPEALLEMTQGSGEDRSPVAPVDLSQAIIGPGMAVFSKYEGVLEADGTPLTVQQALQLINRFLAEDDFDHDTQFCLHWFEQHGWNEAGYGEADVLARAKATSVAGLVEAGVLLSAAGKVRLVKPHEYPEDWDPKKDKRVPVWEAVHQLIRALRKEGESAAGYILAAHMNKGDAIRQLGYRLYTLCERGGMADDARSYNELVTSWTGVEGAAVPLLTAPEGVAAKGKKQLSLFGDKA